MGVPITELFPGFSRPPNDERLLVKEGRYRQEQNYERDYPDEQPPTQTIRRAITTAPQPIEESAEGFRTCPYCDGDGVSGWDEKERDILCQYCEGGIIR